MSFPKIRKLVYFLLIISLFLRFPFKRNGLYKFPFCLFIENIRPYEGARFCRFWNFSLLSFPGYGMIKKM